jgi:membrane protein YdbS with pleckstrin-like domain
MNTQNELRDLWLNEAGCQPAKGGEEMLTLVIEKTRTFDRQIAVRNALECMAAAFVVGLFAWFAWTAPNAIMRAGMAIVAFSGVWIAFYILRYGGGPGRLDPGMDLSAYNRLLAESYDQQIRLLRRVKYWYLLPPYLGILVGNVGVWQRLASEGQNPWVSLLGLGLVTAIFVGIWILNERYAVRRIERLKQELRSIQEGQAR